MKSKILWFILRIGHKTISGKLRARLATSPKIVSFRDKLLLATKKSDSVWLKKIPRKHHGNVDPKTKQNQKRVAILTNMVLDWDTFEPRYGGGERYLIEFTNLLKELGFTIEIFQIARGFSVDVHYWNGIKVNLLTPRKSFSEFQSDICSEFTLQTFEFDHVYHHLPEFTSGLVRSDAIMTCHGIWFDHKNNPDPRFRSRKWLSHLKHAFTSPSVIVSVDTNSISVMRSIFPEIQNQFVHIPNFYNSALFWDDGREQKRREIDLLIPRRAQINRGTRIVAEMLKILPDSMSIVWAGRGDEFENQLLMDLEKKHLNFTFLQSSFDDMEQLYRNAKIVLIPTVASEGTSLSCIEAMASGCAVVSTNVGGLPELVINRYTGLLCTVNALELSKAVIELQNNESLRKELTTTALNFVERLELNYWRKKWIEVLVSQKWISPVLINFLTKE